MKYAYRMVRGLGQLIQDPHLAFGIGRSSKYRFAEVLPANGLGAAECKDNPARRDGLKSSLVQSLIALERIA